MRREIFTSAGSDFSFTNTHPGELDVNRRWCSFFIPFNLMNFSEKNDCQSYAGTSTWPSSDPTSSAKFTLADFLGSRFNVLDAGFQFMV